MSKVKRIREILDNENDADTALLEEMDEAIIGIYRNPAAEQSFPVYSYLGLIELLLGRDLREEEAVEHVDELINGGLSNIIIIDDTGV